MKKRLIGVVCLFALAACGGGGSGGGSTPAPTPNPNFLDDPTPPSPTPPSGSYNGVPYSSLGQPTGLTQSYPSSFWPNNLQIAYGNNNESQIANLAAYVNMDGALCSATPVSYDANSNTTFLIGAAHCFVQSKNSPTTVSSSDLLPTSKLTVYNGVSQAKGWVGTYPVVAVYLRQDYCYNGTFSSGGECPNFSPNYGAANGQGNDISIIQVKGQYAAPESYPQVVPASQYPQTYTMAPILSIGYGFNTQVPNGNLPPGCTAGVNCAVMFYTANYQYWQQDATGYHYLYNSYYNNGGFSQQGYTSLICGGDSGGGDLFWTGSKWILLSEHTYGPSGACGTFYSYLPNGATNVSSYYSWIQSIITNPSPVTNCNSGAISNCVTNGQ